MKKVIARPMLSVILTLLLCLPLMAGIAYAGELREGATVIEDPNSPTGYTVTFVYKNENATRVQLAGDLELRDLNDPPVAHPATGIRYQPEEWQPSRYHLGGREFRRDMNHMGNGYWSISVPMHAGGLSYWYRVWDPSQEWDDKRIWDPTSTHPRPPEGFSWRENRNDVLDAVYVPYHQKQNVAPLKVRGTYELPVEDPAQSGTVHYVEYTTFLDTVGYLGVYLPAGYDENRTTPYPVIYAGHGGGGDETDWMIPGNAPNILDNRIERYELEPTILITMGNSIIRGLDEQSKNVVEAVVPFVEKNYNVSTERNGRAYVGFSAGSMLGINIMNTYHDTFGYYGIFCTSQPSGIDYDRVAQEVGEDVPFIMLGNGIFEQLINQYANVEKNLRDAGFPAVYHRVPGAHDMMSAGQLLTIFTGDYLWKPVGTE